MATPDLLAPTDRKFCYLAESLGRLSYMCSCCHFLRWKSAIADRQLSTVTNDHGSVLLHAGDVQTYMESTFASRYMAAPIEKDQ